MTERQVALYARVSSDQQAEANTIDSQVAEIHARIAADGVDLRHVLAFIDAGYSGSSLVRPALERLRDVAAVGGLDRLYVHCPDRLARHYAYQVLLLEELTQRGVEVIFLNRPLGHTPEDQLLLQVQGVIAEYERAKFLERSRRGKRHAAQAGRVGVLCHAPYGYRYVPKQEGDGDARFDIIGDEARVVQQVFAWVGHDRCTINAVCRRLHQAGVRTRTGKAHWDHKTIWDMLKNPAYKGEAAFGKTRWTPVGPRLHAPRGRPAQSRRGYSGKEVPTDEWITIPVPALIEAALFEAVQAQLGENRRRARVPEKGSRYLLQGLLVCHQCGYAYCGRTNDARNAYYRCAGAMNIPRHGFERVCWNKAVRMDQTDAAVWHEVCRLLAQPERLEQAYRQRLHPQQQAEPYQGLESQMGKLRRGIARLIDSYADGLIDKQEFEPRVTQIRARLQHLEAQVQHLKAEGEMEDELRLIVGRLETFAATVHNGLQQADFHTRREIIRSLVKRVEVDQQHLRVVFRVSPPFLPPSSDNAPNNWQDSGRRVHTGAFHGDVGTARLLEPVGQRSQVGGHRPEGPDLFDGLQPLGTGDQARDHGLFVHVESTAMGIYHVHHAPPCVMAPHGMLASCSISPACFRRAERQTVVPPSIQVLLLAGLRHENLPTFCVRWSGDQHSPFHSRWRGGPHDILLPNCPE
jgi:site-specific DNA recombinase